MPPPGTVASESVRVVRMQTFGADRAIARVVDKLLGRGDDAPAGGASPTVDGGRRARRGRSAGARRRGLGVSSTNTVHVVPPEARGFQGDPAGIASRVLANSVDLAITIASLFAIYGVVAAGLFLRRGARFRFPTADVRSRVHRRGADPHRVLRPDLDGERPDLRRPSAGDPASAPTTASCSSVGVATIRAVLCVLFPLLLFWAVVDRRRRSVQDLIVRTAVVYDWKVRADPPT